MNSLQKRKRKRKAHKAWRKQVHAAHELAHKMRMIILENSKLTETDKLSIDWASWSVDKIDWTCDFYVINYPNGIAVQGSLPEVQETLERFWRLKAFL